MAAFVAPGKGLNMRTSEIYERRAREAEELADLVSLPQNQRRYIAIARAWREMAAAAAADGRAGGPTRAA